MAGHSKLDEAKGKKAPAVRRPASDVDITVHIIRRNKFSARIKNDTHNLTKIATAINNLSYMKTRKERTTARAIITMINNRSLKF